MKKRILLSFWAPPEVSKMVPDDFEVVHPPKGVLTPEELQKMTPEFDGVMLLSERFDKEMIARCKAGKLKVIGRIGVGCDAIDYKYAGEVGLPVIFTPASVAEATAELTISIMMAAARRVVAFDKKLRSDKKCVQPQIFDTDCVTLYGKTLGIVGLGRIGKAAARKGHGLGMKIVYSDVIPAPKEIEDAVGAKRMTLEQLLPQADFVSVHCPYLPENHHLINAKTLAMMKKSAILVNASRGKMVDETALVDALEKGVIKGAALDVFEMEPEVNQKLLAMDNVVLVPHIGTSCYEARIEMAKESMEGMVSVINGKLPGTVFNREFLATK